MFRMLPPAGAPISLVDIARSVWARIGRTDNHQRLERLVSGHSGQGHCFFVDSGKTALLCGLTALAQQTDAFRNEIVIPAYTCFTVPAAVVRAGLKVHPVDIDPMTMDYDFERLEAIDFSKVMAIIGNNLFGIPSKWSVLQTLAKEKGVYLIDDSAQTMGLKYKDKPLGGFGEFGFYSLGRGKNLSAYSGGILVTDSEHLARVIAAEVEGLPGTGIVSELVLIIKTAALSLFLHPRLYWIPASLPFLGLGETVFNPDFDAGKLSRYQVCLTGVKIDHLRDYNQIRRENSRLLVEGITGLSQFRIPGITGTDYPTYLRLPLLTESRETRDRVIDALGQNGVSASPMYPSSVRRIPDIEEHLASTAEDFPGADTVAEKLVTLPTHPYLKKSDIVRMVATLSEI